jgi:hypothetical protein
MKTSRLTREALPPFEGIGLWGAEKEGTTFVVSLTERGEWLVSVKPPLGKIEILGRPTSFEEGKEMAEAWRSSQASSSIPPIR